MAQGQHTPGPWKLIKHEMTFNIVGVDGIEVLKTSWHSSIRARYPLKDEAHANARLAAAAPELLEALAWFVNDIDGSHTNMADFDANVTRARAAIAKAEGRL